MAGTTTHAGTRDAPWTLQTPSGGSEYTAFRDPAADRPALVMKVDARSGVSAP